MNLTITGFSRTTLVVAAVVLVTAWGIASGRNARTQSGQPAPASDESLVGLYRLISVDGQPVPTEVKHGNQPVKIHHGVFRIGPDNQCESRIRFGPPHGGTIVRIVTATYEADDGKLEMDWKNAGRTSGTVSDDTFRMTNEGLEYVYRRIDEQAARSVLDRFIGKWAGKSENSTSDQSYGTATVVTPISSGQFLQESTTHESGNAQTNVLQWDPASGSYRLWGFSSAGRAAEATGVWDPATSTLTWQFQREPGEENTSRATHEFVDSNTLRWVYETADADGEVVFAAEGLLIRETSPE